MGKVEDVYTELKKTANQKEYRKVSYGPFIHINGVMDTLKEICNNELDSGEIKALAKIFEEKKDRTSLTSFRISERRF